MRASAFPAEPFHGIGERTSAPCLRHAQAGPSHCSQDGWCDADVEALVSGHADVTNIASLLYLG